jgi:hypothetical protein
MEDGADLVDSAVISAVAVEVIEAVAVGEQHPHRQRE